MTSKVMLFGVIVLMTLLSFNALAGAQAQSLEPIVNSMQQAEQGMTLWQILKAGGFLMFVLLVLSILTLALVVYDFITFKEVKLAPPAFAEEVIQKLERGDRIGVQELCEKKDNIIAKMVREGISKR